MTIMMKILTPKSKVKEEEEEEDLFVFNDIVEAPSESFAPSSLPRDWFPPASEVVLSVHSQLSTTSRASIGRGRFSSLLLL